MTIVKMRIKAKGLKRLTRLISEHEIEVKSGTHSGSETASLGSMLQNFFFALSSLCTDAFYISQIIYFLNIMLITFSDNTVATQRKYKKINN